MTVTDGAINGTGVDKIRMKIYNRNTGYVYYDNQPGINDASDPVTVVGVNSSIVIQGSASTQSITELSKAETQEEEVKLKVRQLEVLAFPNPSNKHFTLHVRSDDAKSKISIMVFDNNGRLLERKGDIVPGSVVELGGNYRPGVYIVRVVQGRQQAEAKLVKL